MYIQAGKVRLYYEKEGQGKPIILLHGNGEDCSIFDVLTCRLRKRFTVYALDSRNHGNSEKTEKLDYDIMAEDVVSMIRQLGIYRPIICGYSDGGIIGIIIAVKYPDLLSKLIICGANLSPSGLTRRYLFKSWITYLFKRDPLIRLMLTKPNIGLDRIAGITVPVLVLAGSRDDIKTTHTEMIARNIPKSRLKIIEGESHSSYVVHSTKLYPLISSFLIELIE